MTISPEEEVLAVALWVDRNHGKGAPVFIAQQIGALALQHDTAGIGRWKSIAAAWQQLKGGSVQ